MLEKLRSTLRRDFYPWAPVRCEKHRSKDRALRNAAEASTSATFKAGFLIYITQLPLNKTHFRAAASSTNRIKGKTSLPEPPFIQTSTEVPECCPAETQWLTPSGPLRVNRCSSAVRQSGRTGKEVSGYSCMSRNIWISSVLEVENAQKTTFSIFLRFSKLLKSPSQETSENWKQVTIFGTQIWKTENFPCSFCCIFFVWARSSGRG